MEKFVQTIEQGSQCQKQLSLHWDKEVKYKSIQKQSMCFKKSCEAILLQMEGNIYFS